MKELGERLNHLQGWLGTTVGNILDTALSIDVPAGTSPEWVSILKDFDVQPMPEEERQKILVIQPMKRGAPAQEVHEVMDKVVRSATEEHERLDKLLLEMDFSDPQHDEQDKQFQRLRNLLYRLRDETLTKYRAIIMPKVSMFARAKAAAAQQKAPMGKMAESGFVMRCGNCGAPRINDKNFVCEFCDASFA